MLLLWMLLYFRHFSSVRWGADVIIKDVTLFSSFLFSQMRSYMLLLLMLLYFRHFSSVRWGADVIIKDVTLFLSFLFSQMRSWCYYGCYFIFVIYQMRSWCYYYGCYFVFVIYQMRSWCYYYGCYFVFFVISLQSDEELMLLLRMLLYFRHFSSVRWGADVIIIDVTLFSSFLFSQMRSWCYY